MFYKNLLVYITANVDKENNLIAINQINNYKYPENEFIEEIKNRKNNIDLNEIEIYCILGHQKDIKNIKDEITVKINTFFKNIINGNYDENNIEISKETVEKKFYNSYINSLIDETVKFPKTCEIKNYEMSCLALYATDNPHQNKELEINGAIDLFLKNEMPFFMGKQIMIQSFLLQEIKDRKILSVLPNFNGNGWYALLEGGVKLNLNEDLPYKGEKIGSHDVGIFTNLEINSILNNACYSYKKLFEPYELFEEWSDVFLYALAVSPIEYNELNLAKLYEQFLKFIEENICDVTQVEEAIISKEDFIKVLLVKIDNIRNYLKGEEEIGISKNFLMLLKNKYIYLQIIYKLIDDNYTKISLKRISSEDFSLEKWSTLLESIQNKKSNYDKGLALEEAASYFIKCIKGLKETGKRVRLKNEEIDLVCCNVSESLALWNLGAMILIECKNWKEKVDTKVIRNLSYLMEKKGVSSIILFTKNNITSGAKIEVLKQAAHNKFIIVFDLKDLSKLNDNLKPTDLLMQKIEELNENINDEMYYLM